MGSVTLFSPKTHLQSGTGNLDLAVRESVRLRCRAHLETLCADFFDATDDFLFSGGSKSQFNEDSSYLNAMRELRTKQCLFEEAFLGITCATLFTKGGETDRLKAEKTRHLVESHAEIYQMLEVDLALQAMQRKAEKRYAPFIQQIDALLAQLSCHDNAANEHFKLVVSSMWAFGEAQRVYALPLHIRLFVLKLFEQRFLLQLENLFHDVINVIKHALVKGAVNSDCEAINKRDLSSSLAPVESRSESVELAVVREIEELCARPKLPAFVADLLRSKWRTVLFLIGMHRGCYGLEWRESVSAAQLLVDCANGKEKIGGPALDELIGKLRNGFALLRMEESEQTTFENRLRSWVTQQLRASKKMHPSGNSSIITKFGAEASVSPSGKKILDHSDLEEISNLLGAAGANVCKSAIELQLMDSLPEIDQLKEDAVVEFRLGEDFQACMLQKSPSKPGMFNITDRHSKTIISRSRLGLAISLQKGELRLPGPTFSSGIAKKTVKDTASGKTLH